MEIVNVLSTYATEAENARASGPSPRDDTWRANWERYWGRYDHSDKAPWQSRHVMPEAPQFVDRWAAAMREALDSNTREWFTVEDLGTRDPALQSVIQKVIKALLGRCSRTPDGHVTDFSSVFEDQMRLGALMASCASVSWKEDAEGGRVSIDTVDPREVWYDPKGRNLYRRRRYEIDKFELLQAAREADENGDSLYDVDAVLDLMAGVDETERVEKERSTGTGQGGDSPAGRIPIKIDEWLCNIVTPDGELAYANALVVVGNDRHILRGPEENPFWHKSDWIVFTPMISVPMSVYGRSYMEDWADVADAFVELTNLILDGVFTSAVKAFVANPAMLEDPNQLMEGISPNKIFTTAEEIGDVRRFLQSVDLGSLPQEVIAVWQALKDELREGAKLSEIALGQMAPRSRTTATEVVQVQQSGSAMIRSMARTIESRFLEPVLKLVWMTALQHMDFHQLDDVIGAEWAETLNNTRGELADRTINFQVRGISGLIDRQAKLQNLLSALSIISQNETLLGALLQRTSPDRLLEQLFSLFGLDLADLEPTQQERMLAQLQEAQQPADPAGQDLVQ